MSTTLGTRRPWAVDDAAAPAEPPNYEYPAWAHNALGGLPAAINPGIFLGAKTIAAALLDLLTETALLHQAQAEFRERTGGGVGGTKWMAPLLPKNFQPPVDLRWPEYIQTPRGEEWWRRVSRSGPVDDRAACLIS
jgi:aminobenzoyl-glutamate utilization protein B